MMSDVFNFWSWFFNGFTSKEGTRICKRGFSQLFDRWFLVYPVLSVLLSCYTNPSINEISKVVIIPLISVMIGLSVAWISSTFSIAMTDEVYTLFQENSYELVNYLYMFQAIMLLLIVTIAFWIIAGVSNFSVLPGFTKTITATFIIRFALFFLLCMSVRECWQIIVGTYMLVISHLNVKEENRKKNKT